MSNAEPVIIWFYECSLYLNYFLFKFVGMFIRFRNVNESLPPPSLPVLCNGVRRSVFFA